MPTIQVHITATGHALNDEVLPLDVALDLTIADLKAYISAETGLDSSLQQIYLDGRPLANNQQSLSQAGVKEGDLLAAHILEQRTRGQMAGERSGGTGGRPDRSAEIEGARQRFLADPDLLSRVRQANPELAEAINDRSRFSQLFTNNLSREDEIRMERERQMELLDRDPFNIEAQQKIEEIIRQENVMKNLEYAHEHNPEVFASVTMLYINASVNGHNIKVLVDSGAQMTVMSPSCAEACNIMRLIDRRYAGMARGVGTAKILGKVHFADIQISNMILPCSFMVMEGKSVDLLLGLDMLKRYQVSIDLKKNKLVFPGEEVDFLPESEIPTWMEEERAAEPTVPGPDGIEIGTESGLIRQASNSVRPGGDAGVPGQTLEGVPPGIKNTPAAPASGPSQSPAKAQASSSAQAAASRYPQASIDHLVNLGFSRQEAISALDATDGNLEYAAGLLFGA